MKTALLLHGTGGNNKDYFWFEDTKLFLEKHGYAVWWPQLPNTDKPDFQETLVFVEKNMPVLDSDTIIIGHSSSCPLILSLLQLVKAPIKQVVLVAGYYEPSPDQSTLLMQSKEFDWEAIKSVCKNIMFINSDNDPWGCDDKQALPSVNKLGANFILAKGQGHMGSNAYNQPYRKNNLVKNVLTL